MTPRPPFINFIKKTGEMVKGAFPKTKHNSNINILRPVPQLSSIQLGLHSGCIQIHCGYASDLCLIVFVDLFS